jgi:Domain of unknown function (DUF1906)
MGILRTCSARRLGPMSWAIALAVATLMSPVTATASTNTASAAHPLVTSSQSCPAIPGKPSSTGAVCGHELAPSGPGQPSKAVLPKGETQCPSLPNKAASTRGASCRPGAAGSTEPGAMSLPAGRTQCASSARKESSAAAACWNAPVPGQSTTPDGLSLPPGAARCPSVGLKQSSAYAACATGPSPVADGPSTTKVSLPAGATPCPSTAGKHSSPTAACNVTSSSTAGLRLYNIAGYSISLYESTNALAPGRSITLSAYANLDVGPTPYYIEFYDRTTGGQLNYCAYGSSCSTSVSESSPTTHSFIAYIGSWSSTNPPGTVAATSNVVSCTWLGVSVYASPQYTSPGSWSLVTVYANTDVGPTPYWLELFDESTGANLAICASGSSCSAWVSQGAATVHWYAGYASSYGTSNPPPSVQASASNFVVWFGISLTATPAAMSPGQTTSLQANANTNVGPSPYWISIFDETTGARVALCASGSTCGVNINQASSTIRDYIAYVGGSGTTRPPSPVQATSNYVEVTWLSVSLAVDATVLPPGVYVGMTATASQDIGPTLYAIDIFDVTAGSIVAHCGTGITCYTAVTQPSATIHSYQARIDCAGSCQAPAIRATSNQVTVTWVSVSLRASTNGQVAGNWVTLTATANANITYTPYDIWISDQTTQQNVGVCTSGSSCSLPITESVAGTHTFIAYVAKPGGTYPPTGIAATSSTLPIYWVSWGVDSSWSPITDTMLSSVTSALGKPDFWGRYIGQTGTAPDMTASEATLAHQNGIKILPIFSEYTQGQTSGYSTGVYFASYAAVAANSLGIPGGTMIAIDIEHNSYVNAAFIQGWYDGLVAKNYVPAIYANPGDTYFPGAYCTAVANQPAIGTNLLLYSVEPSLLHLPRASAYGWGPSAPGCANNTQVWQYNLSGGSNPNVDLDEALASAPLW